ncbi:MAG TPA: SDR family oxidoreductase [Streptosporangiaceae bacterium]|nr:SDR family oxidoreductase [Streptosporangiaceae bacterium]
MARIVIVTGAASGIGRALASALVARGDTVVVADIDGEGAERAAGELARHGPGAATAARVDVRDAAAVRALVHGTRDRYGRLDVMVNNAGIGVGGEASELLLAHWDRVIDVNLRGVVHGVHAAYPVMIAQRSGHIVNTASLAGLLPSPGLTPYAMTKHAVVGLSLSLRAEAAAYGVGVTAVCPGVVDTPLLDGRGPADLPQPALMGHVREIMRRYQPRFYPATQLAEDILRGIDRDAALVIAPASARVAWRLWRYAPVLVNQRNARQLAWTRATFPAQPAEPAAADHAREPATRGRDRGD